ncbi:MAG: hypothetical protein IPG59_16760 [Candidatus Melainabacteria bacterium]|nr:MAG: hypothetical protein IPG59_16760 [Candidatus Melainabacteria bacterium]
MKTSITTSATLGIILAVASFVAMPAAHAESMSGGPLNTQSTSQATTKNESKAEVNDQSMSRGQLVTPVEPQANVPTKVTPAPAATRARTVRERQAMSTQITEIARGSKSRSTRKVSSRKPAKKPSGKLQTTNTTMAKPPKLAPHIVPKLDS